MISNRVLTLTLATFGGGAVAGFGALMAAGNWPLSLLPLVVGTVLLVAANVRLLEMERVIEVMYSGPADDDFYVDAAGPFGWMGFKEGEG